MREDEIIIKRILGVLLEQSLKDKKDMTLTEFYKKIHKKDFEKVKHIIVNYTDRVGNLINMCMDNKCTDDVNTIRINEENGIPYLERLEQKEKDEKRDRLIEKQADFNKIIALTGSIVALYYLYLFFIEILKYNSLFKSLTDPIIAVTTLVVAFLLGALTFILFIIIIKEYIFPLFRKAISKK